jgi:hypothetical protein
LKTELTNKKLGSNIDSWCGKCKMLLAHTIEAMVGDKPKRVICNTCKSQHAYRAQEAKTSSGPRPVKSAANKYQSALKASSAGVVKAYSPTSKYEAGDIVDHRTLGRGVTTAVKEGAKIEVLFESGLKTLIHAR